jgi:hypothetical protein
LSALERDGLTLAKFIEPDVAARRVVKEVLIAVVCGDEAEPFVADEAFDSTVHRCHCILLIPE